MRTMAAPSLPKGSQEIVKDRLYFTSLKKHSPHRRNKDANSKIHLFSIDNQLKYLPFFADFGPLNLGHLYRFCCLLSDKLADAERNGKTIVYYCRAEPKKFANAAYLIGAFQIICLNRSAADAFAPFKGTAFIPFRDASMGPCHYAHTVEHCLEAVEKAKKHKFLDFHNFDVQEYEFYERVECGDFNIIVPGKFLAFSGPNNRTIDAEGYPALTPSHYVPIFGKAGVSTIIRLNRRCYDRRKFTEKGFTHFDLIYPDGTNPPPRVLETFLEICAASPGIVAVHCKAGLGRTGTLIACYMMRFWGWTARECIAWIRICRPGSVIGPQQHYLLEREKEMHALYKRDQHRASIAHPAGSLMPRHLANASERAASPPHPTDLVASASATPKSNPRRSLGRLTRDASGSWSRQTTGSATSEKSIKIGDLDFGDEDRFRSTSSAVLSGFLSQNPFINAARSGFTSRAENTPRNHAASPNSKPPRSKKDSTKREPKTEPKRVSSRSITSGGSSSSKASSSNAPKTTRAMSIATSTPVSRQADLSVLRAASIVDRGTTGGSVVTPEGGGAGTRRYVLDGDRNIAVESRSPAGLRPDQVSQGRYLLNAKRSAKKPSPPVSTDLKGRARASSMRPTPIHTLRAGSKSTNKDRSKSTAKTTTTTLVSRDDLWSAVTTTSSSTPKSKGIAGSSSSGREVMEKLVSSTAKDAVTSSRHSSVKSGVRRRLFD